jgi:hypothetical protein
MTSAWPAKVSGNKTLQADQNALHALPGKVRINNFSILVHKVLYQPGAGDAVYLWSFSRNPLHFYD